MSARQSVILFADNHPVFLDTRKQFLERAGYKVVTATDAKTTRMLLREEKFDLAIIDLRLADNENDDDHTGLDIAIEEAPLVPKIILTIFPNFESARALFKYSLTNGTSVAVDYLDKQEGGEALIRAIKAALGQKDVFLVHGHDNETKETVARFLERLRLKPIILHEQPNRGLPLIDKLIENSSVAYVIVLLTPDDLGYKKTDPNQLKTRARQNVIFELGFFLGKFGHGKVCVLQKGDIEVPSDYTGVLFTIMDSNDWRVELAREMKAAGLPIDLNLLIDL